jgi:Ca2+/Na+ antiporter
MTEKHRIGHPILFVPLGMGIVILSVAFGLSFIWDGEWYIGAPILLLGFALVAYLWLVAERREQELTREFTPGWDFNAQALAKPLLGLLVSLFMLFGGVSWLNVTTPNLEPALYIFFLVLGIVSFAWIIISQRG